MPAVTTLHQSRTLHAAIKAMGAVSALDTSASGTAIGVMNWASWEHRIQCKRRQEMWRLQAGTKVEGSRQIIYDTRPTLTVGFDYAKMLDRFQDFKYTGVITGRMGSGKSTTAAQVMAQQQFMGRVLRPAQQKLTEFYSHAIDAMAYGAMKYGSMHDELWDTGTLRQPHYHERASRWQSNLTGSGPSVSDILSSAPDTSRSDGNKSKHGWLSRTPKQSTGWSPKPRTRPIQFQRLAG